MKLDKCLNMAVIPRISILADRVYEFFAMCSNKELKVHVK